MIGGIDHDIVRVEIIVQELLSKFCQHRHRLSFKAFEETFDQAALACRHRADQKPQVGGVLDVPEQLVVDTKMMEVTHGLREPCDASSEIAPQRGGLRHQMYRCALKKGQHPYDPRRAVVEGDGQLDITVQRWEDS